MPCPRSRVAPGKNKPAAPPAWRKVLLHNPILFSCASLFGGSSGLRLRDITQHSRSDAQPGALQLVVARFVSRQLAGRVLLAPQPAVGKRQLIVSVCILGLEANRPLQRFHSILRPSRGYQRFPQADERLGETRIDARRPLEMFNG